MVRAQAPGAPEDGVCREKLPNDPDDLEEDDLGLASRAPRRAQKAASSDGDEAAASSQHETRRKGRKRRAVSQPEDEDDEPEDEDDELAVDELLGRKVVSDEDFKQDCRFEPGTVLYLVAWEGCGDDENTWEPCKHISNDLIRDYYDSTSGRSWRARLPMRRVSQRMMMATTSLWKWTSKRRRSSRFYLCGLSSTSIITTQRETAASFVCG